MVRGWWVLRGGGLPLVGSSASVGSPRWGREMAVRGSLEDVGVSVGGVGVGVERERDVGGAGAREGCRGSRDKIAGTGDRVLHVPEPCNTKSRRVIL